MIVESKSTLIDPSAFHTGEITAAEHPTASAADVRLSYQEAMRTYEREYLSAVLESCGGNVKLAAGKMGLHISTLYRKLEKFGLTPAGTAASPGDSF